MFSFLSLHSFIPLFPLPKTPRNNEEVMERGQAGTKTVQNTLQEICEGCGRSSFPYLVVPQCSLGERGSFLNVSQKNDGCVLYSMRGMS